LGGESREKGDGCELNGGGVPSREYLARENGERERRGGKDVRGRGERRGGERNISFLLLRKGTARPREKGKTGARQGGP